MKTQIVSILSATASIFFLSVNCSAVNPIMKVKSLPTEVKIEIDEEKPLEIEHWMLDQSNWHYNAKGTATEGLSIEPWMIDEKLWTKKKLESGKNEACYDKESKISIEPWMLDENLWQPKKVKS